MEATEIYNLGLHELITDIFAVDWSQDNQISVITERGVHILELQPNPLCVQPTAKFHRSFIYPSSYLSVEPFLSVISNVMNRFDRDDLYSFMMEQTLTPKLPDKDDHIPRVSTTAWSPKKMVKPSKCLLAIVTSAGTIDLTFKIGNNWYSIYNLSVHWWDTIKNEMEYNPDDIEVDDVNAESFKKSLRRLVTTAAVWSNLYEKLSTLSPLIFCYLVTAYRSGDLVIWKIIQLAELTMKVEPTIALRIVLDTEVKITKLLWITLDVNKYLIVIGFFDGKIYGIQITETDNNELEHQILYKYESNTDYMPVVCLREFFRHKNFINIIVIKNFFFIVMTLNNEGEFVKQEYVQLMGFPISGLTVVNEGSVIVTTRDSKIFHILQSKETGLLRIKQMEHDMKASKVQYLGLAGAPNNALFINVTSPNYLHDHLINREPSIIQLFNFKNDKWDPWEMLNKNVSRLNTHWNCLEIIRIKAAREADPETILPTINKNLESMSIHKLRIIMWLTLITGVVKKKKILKKIDKIVGEISEAQPLIFVHTASMHIIKLFERQELTDDMRLSVHFLRLYLEVFLAGEDDNDNNGSKSVINLAKRALYLTTKMNLIETEFCSLCGEIVTELPWNTSSCPKGHKLPRCALSLLQITCVKYRNCFVCGRIFHPLLDDIYDELNCLYCDVPAVYDSRIVDVYDELEQQCLNLSLRPLSDVSNNKIQDGDVVPVPAKNSKKRRTNNNNDSFTLIVNKDDEAITETWEEL